MDESVPSFTRFAAEIGTPLRRPTLPAQEATQGPHPEPRLPDTEDVAAFGISLRLAAPKHCFLRADSLWRLRHIYEPALAAQTLSETGVAVDIGAGFGSFALPFATAFPGWKIYCFEPDPASFLSLSCNIEALGLANVVALPFAVGALAGDAPDDLPAARLLIEALAAGVAGAADPLGRLLPLREYSGHLRSVGYLQAGPPPTGDFHPVYARTLAAGLLTALDPRLLKIVAPGAAAEILADLSGAELDHILGETWSHIPASLIHGDRPGLRQTWLPRAGMPFLSLRRSVDTPGADQRLDVVVPLYNQRAHVVPCVAGILDGNASETGVIVVDDGSTDGSGDLVRAAFAGDARVRVLTKPNGGCASARNFGRMHSTASHIAFVDADDLPGPGLFAGLQDLARQTGAEIVQGGFELVYDEPGGLRREASYEARADPVLQAQRHHFGATTCHLLPSAWLIEGQPTIWRRVYRRDFLDNRKIWFPEHIRAFDDQIFQTLTLQAVADVPVLDGVTYGYRQHPGQDIRQGDERNFYVLEMFRLILKRGILEGWADFRPALRSFVNTVNWTVAKLRPDLRPAFLRGAAELWVYAHKTLGDRPFDALPVSSFQSPEFAPHFRTFEDKLRPLGISHAWAFLDSLDMHVPRTTAARQ